MEELYTGYKIWSSTETKQNDSLFWRFDFDNAIIKSSGLG